MSKEVEVLKEGTNKGEVVAVETTGGDLAAIGDLGFLTIDPTLIGGSAQVVELGTKIKSQGLEKYRGTEGKRDRIAFLVGTPVVIRFHYISGIGYVQCFGGDCCDVDPSPAKVRYLFPIVEYIKIEDHKYSETCGFEIKVLSCGNDFYENILTIDQTLKEDGDKLGIIGVDFNVSCVDEEYQKLQIVPTKKALWKEKPEIIDYLKEHWGEIQKEIPTSIAKDLGKDKFNKLLSALNEQSSEVDEDEDEKPAKKKDKKKYLEEDDE